MHGTLCLTPLCIVPIPDTVNVTAPNTQIVGQLLTLECSVTTVRGITNRVDIVWSLRNRSNFVTIEDLNVTTELENSLLFENSYTVPLLSTDDDSSIYECAIVINAHTVVVASSDVTLDVAGK